MESFEDGGEGCLVLGIERLCCIAETESGESFFEDEEKDVGMVLAFYMVFASIWLALFDYVDSWSVSRDASGV